MYIIINVIVFLIGSLFGWVMEYTKGRIENDKDLIERNKCGDTVITGVFRQCLPLLNIYGVGAVLILNIYNYFKTILSTIEIILLCFVSVLLLECVVASINYKLLNKKTWDYGTNICYGGIDIVPSIWWFILVSITVLSFDNFTNYK